MQPSERPWPVVLLWQMLRSIMTPPVFRIKQNAEFELDHDELPCYNEALCADLLTCDIDLRRAVFRARVYTVDGQCAFLALACHHVRSCGI